VPVEPFVHNKTGYEMNLGYEIDDNLILVQIRTQTDCRSGCVMAASANTTKTTTTEKSTTTKKENYDDDHDDDHDDDYDDDYDGDEDYDNDDEDDNDPGMPILDNKMIHHPVLRAKENETAAVHSFIYSESFILMGKVVDSVLMVYIGYMTNRVIDVYLIICC